MMMRGELNRASPLGQSCDVARTKDRPHLRGRRPVRADRRLRADEKHIRTQSAILYKSNSKPVLFLIHNRVFCADALFIRAENTVGARSAQWSLLRCSSIKAPYLELQ
jgi:hypothetical protein